MVKVTDIEPNPNQPRTNFNEDALNELAESIKRIGVIEPIVVYKKDRGYEIIAGERRWRAARLAGIKEVPVIIRKYTKQQRVEIALIENIQRENLNPIEEALAYNRLIEEFKLKQDEVAERVSKSRTAITNSLRLLKLCDKVKEMVVEQMISAGHARALITIEDPDVQYETAMTIFDQGLSVRDTEQLVKDVNNILATQPKDKVETPKEDNTALLAILSQMENNLKTTLGTKVKIKPRGKNKGRIEIEYFSSDDLERIIHIINTKEQL
jgi:ParB family chromosome partitioning protein